MEALEDKLLSLEARLKSENDSSRRDVAMSTDMSAFCSPVRHGSGRRPMQLGDIGTPTRTRKQLDLPVSALMHQKTPENSEVDSKMKEIMKHNGILNINGKQYRTEIKDLEHLGELGNGTCGQVVKMLHKPSNTIIAVKQMRRSSNSDDNKRIIMDLDVVFKSLACPYIVSYLGCFVTQLDVWICMELMATCFDRLLKRLKMAVPEDILGKVTVATIKALHYLKESHGVIHRDVKPSNILLDERGNIKLCDFGISGQLVDSKAKTKNAGCAAYMAPERIEPPDPRKPDYDIRADVWSFGITLVELATGMFPYKDCKCDFEVLSRVLHEDPPTLPNDPTRFSFEFRNFVSNCLMKDFRQRPKYRKLLEHPFLKRYETKYVDVADWYARSIGKSPAPIDSAPRYSGTCASKWQSSTQQHQPLSRWIISDNAAVKSGEYGKFGVGYINNNGGGGVVGVSAGANYPCKRHPQVSTGHEKPDNTLIGNNYCASPIMRRHHLPTLDQSTNGTVPGQMNECRTCNSSNTSPLVLQRFYHQQHKYSNNTNSNVGNVQSSHKYRSTSLSPSRRYATENVKLPEPTFMPPVAASTKKRFASFLKFNLGSTSSSVNVLESPTRPPSPAPPSPPPRFNRLYNLGSTSPGHSPLFARRHFLETASPSVLHRIYGDTSPSHQCGYIPVCPTPAPRYAQHPGCTTSSTPSSPQLFNYRRNEFTAARVHFTPQPQRRAFCKISDI